MTRTAGAPMSCRRSSRFWGLGCPKIFHEIEDSLAVHGQGQPENPGQRSQGLRLGIHSPLSTPRWTRDTVGSSSAPFAPPLHSMPISISPMWARSAGSNARSACPRPAGHAQNRSSASPTSPRNRPTPGNCWHSTGGTGVSRTASIGSAMSRSMRTAASAARHGERSEGG